jgi:hypothetical protein
MVNYHNYRLFHHPNLSGLIDVVEIEQGVAILTQLIYGSNLHQVIFEEKIEVAWL